MKKMPLQDALRSAAIAFAVLTLILMLSNAVRFFTSGSYFSRVYLYTPPVGGRMYALPWWLLIFYEWTIGSTGWIYETIGGYFYDPYYFLRPLVLAPILEELLYRGPLWVLGRHARERWWMLLAVLIGIVFAFGHPRGLGFLVPIFGLGISTAWVIRQTGRLWLAMAFHSVYNISMVFANIAATIGGS